MRVLEPSGIIGLTALPVVTEQGVSLTCLDVVGTVAKPLGFRLGATKPGVYRYVCLVSESTLTYTSIITYALIVYTASVSLSAR